MVQSCDASGQRLEVRFPVRGRAEPSTRQWLRTPPKYAQTNFHGNREDLKAELRVIDGCARVGHDCHPLHEAEQMERVAQFESLRMAVITRDHEGGNARGSEPAELFHGEDDSWIVRRRAIE